jgi:hypothetical protein
MIVSPSNGRTAPKIKLQTIRNGLAGGSKSAQKFRLAHRFSTKHLAFSFLDIFTFCDIQKGIDHPVPSWHCDNIAVDIRTRPEST